MAGRSGPPSGVPAIACGISTTIRRVARAAGALAAAWTVAAAAHLLRLDWLVAALAVGGVAAVLPRAGSALDRIMVSLPLLAGAVCAAALALSYAPWGLHPGFLGGLGLGVPAAVAAARGRRPRARPGRPARASRDLVVLVPAGVAAVALAAPFAGRDVAGRLALVFRVEDMARHFAMYDTIRRLGGYPFLHPEAAAATVIRPDLSYPAGAHVFAAVVDNLVTSSAAPGEPLAELGRLLWYAVAAYAFAVLAVLWAARRVAGPVASAAAFAPIAGAVVGYLLFSESITGLLWGFVPQTLGLAYLAVLVALCARPLPDTRAQLLVLAATLVALAFTYYLLLPVAGAAVVAFAVSARGRLRDRPWWTVGAVVAVVVLCPLPRLWNAGDHPLAVLWEQFGIVRVSRPAVLALALLVVAAARPWRAPSTRAVATALAAMVGSTLAVGALQLHHTGATTYFFEKSLHGAVVVLLVASGTAASSLRRLTGTRLTAAATALALAVLPAAALGGFEQHAHVSTAGFPRPVEGTSWGRAYLAGRLGCDAPARLAVQVYRVVPDPARRPTLIVTGTPGEDLSMVWTAALQRDLGTTWDTYLWTLRAWPARDPASLRRHLLDQPPPDGLQLVTTDPALLDAVRSIPGVEAVDARTLRDR
jgi:hypothetical protein